MRLIKFVPTLLIKLKILQLFFLFVPSFTRAEKTLCERRLAVLPPAGPFYYQRIELNSAARCAERCVDDWEFCRSAVLIEDIRNKSLCQLYGSSFESHIPLNPLTLSSLQTDPNRLLPITLIELTDAPCSSKFARHATILDQISAVAREQLRLIPGPAVRNRLDLAAVHSEKPKEIDIDPFREHGKMEQQQQLLNIDEAQQSAAGGKASDETYLVPFSAASLSHQQQPSGFSSSSNGNAEFVGGQPPAPLQFPRNGLPIQPVIVSRGGNRQQYNNIGCPSGICPRIGAQLNNEDDVLQQQQPATPCAARTSSDPCAPQAQWMEWTSSTSGCSVTCGSGWRERRRYCSSGNQDKCKGEATDREQCIMPACNQWTEWTDWTQCSKSCGGGQQMKRRTCQNGDQCVGAPNESRTCNDEQCPTWANWGSWSECSTTCGTGVQRRVRECTSRHSANCAVGNAVEHRECESRSCPEWAQWEPWSTCSKSCGAGESVRRRECRNAAPKEQCQGAAVERLLCNTQPCPALTEWTDWSSCTKSCGTGGTQTRKRECRHNGMFSDQCTGATSEQKPCKPLEACPNWAEWGEWSDCTTTCGHGQQKRVRKCLPLGYGCAGNENDVRSCQKASCPYFDQWSEWGGCSVTCGRGFCERTRKCIKQHSSDDSAKEPSAEGLMPIREEMVEGTKREKGPPEDITSVDTLRPRTLEVIQSSSVLRRSPLISAKLGLFNEEDSVDRREAISSGTHHYDTKIVPISAGDCVGPNVERKACDAGPCCDWSPWSPWSNCIVQCGSTGYRDRSRRCELTKVTGTETTVGNNNAFAGAPQQPIPMFPFGSQRNNNAFGSAALRCAICVGDSRQTESCAIPAPKGICSVQRNDEMMPLLQRAEAKTPSAGGFSLLREGIGVKEDDTYVTDSMGGGGEASLRIKDERKRSSSPATAAEDGPVTATTRRVAHATTTATAADVLQLSNNNCAWTQWSAWSDCGGAECSKRRSRTCDVSLSDKKGCQCQGNYVQQTKCPPEECQQQQKLNNVFVDETIGQVTPLKLKELLMDEPKSKSSHLPSGATSFIQSVQLIPRHKSSGEETKQQLHEEAEAIQQNGNVRLPIELSSLNSGTDKLIRISRFKVTDQKSPSSATVECDIDDWLQWSGWSACDGSCSGTRDGHRKRQRRCACERGCAGISEESLSCTVLDCS